jgi:hypothetical protein
MERLELLGDSILKYAVSCHLFLKYPEKHEGQLTARRSWAVCNATLHKLGTDHKLQVSDHISAIYGLDLFNWFLFGISLYKQTKLLDLFSMRICAVSVIIHLYLKNVELYLFFSMCDSESFEISPYRENLQYMIFHIKKGCVSRFVASGQGGSIYTCAGFNITNAGVFRSYCTPQSRGLT